ncbi:MAG: AMP-binding protein [Clostridia bacterium]|nr:AMP-binding protein [Clostridia bacterium]
MKSTTKYAVRNIDNLKDMIKQSVNLFGSKNAFYIKNSEGNYTNISYTDFGSDIEALGTALLDMGLEDQYIAVLGENRYEWCVTYLATVNGTGIIVPLDKELKLHEIENLLSVSKASALVYSGKFHKDIQTLSAKLPSVKYFINMDIDSHQEGFLSFKQLIEKGKELIACGSKIFTDAKVCTDEAKILIFTSGTTGHAKGVMLSHKNICFDITAVCSTVHIDSTDSSLSVLPLHHTYECTLGFLALIYNGCTISFSEGLKHIAKNLKEVKPTVLFVVPLLLENVYKKIWEQASKQKGGKFKLKAAITISNLLHIFNIDLRRKLFKPIHESLGERLRLVLTGAAAIDPSVSKGFRSMGIMVLQGYGLTECSPLVTGNNDTHFKDASIGLPLPGVDVRIDNPGKDGIGELIVKGDNVMLGYFNDKASTDKILKDGWFYTGDLGYRDKSGFFYITGRKKNVIVTKNGKNIFPEEVESYINKSAYVQESLVWGLYDKISGETLVNAQIVPNFEAIKERLKLADITKEDVLRVIKNEIKNINKNMPLYKHIRDFSIRENEFIKTTTRKIKRYVENSHSST